MNQVHAGTAPSKKMGMTPQYFHAIPPSCAILRHFANYFLCLLLVHIGARVVEGSGLGSAVCVVNVDVH